MNIEFLDQQITATHDGVVFVAKVDGQMRECLVSARALQDHFGANSGNAHDLKRAFISGRAEIQAVARQNLPNSSGECKILSADFGPTPVP